MKVEIGEYLRLDNGRIYKWESNDYEWIYEEDEQLVYGNGANEYEWECDIKKHSFNIIDLIEVGDIVNYGLIGGGMVLHKENDKIATNTLLFGILKNEDIKTVITKEQLKNCMYEVGD